MSVRPHSRLRHFARPLVIWAALLVLCCGLPRQLVLCTGPHCHGVIEWVHASGTCCAGHHERSAHPVSSEATAAGSHRGCCGDHHHDHERGGYEREDDTLRADHHGCHDVPLALDEGPLPERTQLGAELALLPPATWPTFVLAPRAHAALLPPTTGPPRPSRLLACRSTTVLQL
ncbi:MAG: hypothetical protein JNL12_08525 [Planctomycetes bacterium]|nr:hypothetical protein [Planctomycetota bacterium]